MVASAALGSLTFTNWKRRDRAASFSKYFLYSLQVVAAMVFSSPRASAGLSRLDISSPPCWLPAPIRVCASSINRMTGTGEEMTSAISPLKRFSNSPFTDAPACNAPKSRVMISVFFSLSGTWPATMRSASPSIKALLPTPASPTTTGLFLRRRQRMSIIRSISWSRHSTGSSLPLRASAVMFLA